MRKPFLLRTLLDTIEQLLPEVPKSEDENFEEMTQVIVDKGERGRRLDAQTSVKLPSPINSYPLSMTLYRFYALAVKSLTTENIDFIRAVINYEAGVQSLLQQEIMKSSGVASDMMREAAKKLYEIYIKQNCEQEVLLTIVKYYFLCLDESANLTSSSSSPSHYHIGCDPSCNSPS